MPEGMLAQLSRQNEEAVSLAEMDRTDQLREYATLLRREASPEAGDVERMSELLGQLGITTDDAVAHGALIRKTEKLLGYYRSHDRIREQMTEIAAKLPEVERRQKEAAKELDELRGTYLQLQSQRSDTVQARHELLTLIAANPVLTIFSELI